MRQVWLVWWGWRLRTGGGRPGIVGREFLCQVRRVRLVWWVWWVWWGWRVRLVWWGWRLRTGGGCSGIVGREFLCQVRLVRLVCGERVRFRGRRGLLVGPERLEKVIYGRADPSRWAGRSRGWPCGHLPTPPPCGEASPAAVGASSPLDGSAPLHSLLGLHLSLAQADAATKTPRPRVLRVRHDASLASAQGDRPQLFFGCFAGVGGIRGPLAVRLRSLPKATTPVRPQGATRATSCWSHTLGREQRQCMVGGRRCQTGAAGVTTRARQFEQFSQILLGCGALGSRANKTLRTSTWCPLGFTSRTAHHF